MSYGAAGLLGLGFDSLSNIDAYVNSTGASTGRSLLYNLFLDNPSEPNFIALSLQSTSDGDQVTGSFAIGKFTVLLLYALVDASECRRDRVPILKCHKHQQNPNLARRISSALECAVGLLYCWHRDLFGFNWCSGSAIEQGSRSSG